MRLQLITALVVVCGVAHADDDVLHEIEATNAAKPNEAPVATSEPMTGTVRAGVYHDSDQTTIWRVLAVMGKTWGDWKVGVTFTADSVSSASVDVRSSPALAVVDTVTTASGNSHSGGMTDTRYQGTGTVGWTDGGGTAVNVTGAAATEHDYQSINGGINGSYDILDRNATLLGGLAITDNWVSSVLDPLLHRKMFAVAWSLGYARVLGRDDAIRVRYDGKVDRGDNSSPYRNVRFGDWIATVDPNANTISFGNTIGSSDGLIERTPATRQSNAAVFEWVHSLGDGLGLHTTTRLARDNWSVTSITAGAELRVAHTDWRLALGYRFYAQTAANFFLDQYMLDPSNYSYYTSDKELGREIGHLGHLDITHALSLPMGAGGARPMLNIQLDVIHYDYPGFVLLPSRDSMLLLFGLSLER